jgi:hypothetical protein
VQRAPSLDALVDAARSTIDYWAGRAGHGEMAVALDRLRQRDLAGIAMLLEALPLPRPSRAPASDASRVIEPRGAVARSSRLDGI